jgi:hypothetical protein
MHPETITPVKTLDDLVLRLQQVSSVTEYLLLRFQEELNAPESMAEVAQLLFHRGNLLDSLSGTLPAVSPDYAEQIDSLRLQMVNDDALLGTLLKNKHQHLHELIQSLRQSKKMIGHYRSGTS